jgi:hypothetical protein
MSGESIINIASAIAQNGVRAIVCIGLLVLISCQGFAQTRNITEVEIKPSNSSQYPYNQIEEEKALEFFIVGIEGQEDLMTVEDLLTGQKGIDRARTSGVNNFCTVITLKGSNIGEEFVTALLASKGFKIENYSERWIRKRTARKGERVFIQHSSPQSKKSEQLENQNKNKN